MSAPNEPGKMGDDFIPPKEQEKLEELSERIRKVLKLKASPEFPELTDEDFIPRDEAHPLEELRESIRRALVGGATQSEIEDELIRNGFEADFAIQLVSSVRTTGQSRDLEVGSEVFIGGQSAGFLTNPTYERQARLMRRRARREREAVEGGAGPAPELGFEAEGEPTSDRKRYLRNHALRFWLLLLTLLALAAAGVFSVFRE